MHKRPQIKDFSVVNACSLHTRDSWRVRYVKLD